MAMFKEALKRAIQIKGSQQALAAEIGISQARVSQLLNDEGSRLPAEIALQIETATAGQVGRHELRPDIFATPFEAA